MTITVTNVDEEGTVGLFPAQPRVGTVLRATISDPDDDVRSVNWRWERSSDQTAWASRSGSGASYTPTSGDEGMYLRATATYTDGEGAGKSAEAASGSAVAAREDAPAITVVELVSGLSIPWGIAFTPDGTMLFTQRSGVLSASLTDGTVQTVTADFSDLRARGETGLMGIVVDPGFASNRRFYTCQGQTGPEIQVIAWTLNAGYTVATRVADPLVGSLPAASGGRHGGCRLRFGPQGYLWIATGDAARGTVPQDLNSLGGKVLRVDASTGTAAPGNALETRVYTYGHRNVQGLARRPGTNQMWSVEHGPSIDDEINLLVKGGNYGWNPVTGYNESVPMTDLAQFPDAVEAKWSSGDPTLATSGGIFLDGDDWDEWEGRLAVATLAGRSLRIFRFTSSGALVSQVVVPELNGTYGRLRTPMLGPDGALYLTTSNGSGTDKILKVVPGRPPAFAGATDTREVAENNSTSAVVATVTATDPDGERLTYTLGGRDARFFAIANPAAGGLRANVRFDHEAQSSYEVVVTATDPYGLSDSVTLTITVTDVDEAPEVAGEAHVTIEENSTEYVGHYSATDPEGVPPSWTALSGPDRSHFKVDAAGDLSFTTVPDYDARADANRDNRYEVTVGASDGTLTGTLNVTVTVTNVNEPPKVTGDEAVDFTEGGTGSVATYTASDPEGGTLVWQALEGTDAGDFTFSNGVLQFATTPDFESPTDAGGDNGYRVRVRVSDGPNDDALDVTVSVTNKEEAGALTFSSEQPEIGSVLTATLTDPDNVVSESWTWERSPNRNIWTELSGQPGNSYAPVDDDLSHYLRVTVDYTDGHGSGKSLQLVTDRAVREPPPVNDPPAFADASTTRSVPENSGEGVAVGDEVTATDDNNDPLTYSLAGDVDTFTVDDSSGQIRVAEGAVLDHETRPTYRVTVTATDPSNASDSISVDITVTDVNEAPEPTDDTRTTDEDVQTVIDVLTNDNDPEGDDLTVSLRSRPDNGATTLDATTNEITYTPNADYHGADSFTYRVSDGSLSSDAGVNVTVTSVNDAPEFPTDTATRSVVQNAQPGANVGRPVIATDVDSDVLTYSLSGAPEFEIEEHTGQIKVGEVAILDASVIYTVTVTATEARTDGQVPASDSIEVTITVRTGGSGGGGGAGGGGGGGSAPANREPEFDDGQRTTRRVPENTPMGGAFGDPVTATDDDDATLTYTLRGDDAGSFTIDGRTGQLQAKALLDYETRANYRLEVRVSDGEGGDDAIRVTVSVTNVDEPPLISGPEATEYEENGEDAVASYAAADPEGGEVVAWSLAGDDAGLFSIGNAGVLAFNDPPDYETPLDVDGDNVYRVVIQATDVSDITGTLDVAVTVTDADDGGIVARYDADGDGVIDRGEALAAVSDYFADLITKSEAVEVVTHYFIG